MAKDKKNNSFLDKIRYKYRLVIINDDTFEQKTSIKLSKFNIYIWIGSFVLVVVFFVTSLIAFTNIKYYLPGIGKIEFRQKINKLSHQTDSLTAEIDKRNLWIGNFQKIVSGNIESFKYTEVDSSTKKIDLNKIDLNYIPEEDKKLREEVENQIEFEKINKKIRNSEFEDEVFSTLKMKLKLGNPVEGTIIKSFSYGDEHFGIDIAGEKNEPIKSIYSGTVIISEWNPKTGNVIAIQHPGDMVSFYKHNSVLLKKRGTFVKKGEAIAIIGNSGELTTGPHLHFEIWQNGNIQDPSKYINIEKLNLD